MLKNEGARLQKSRVEIETESRLTLLERTFPGRSDMISGLCHSLSICLIYLCRDPTAERL